MSMDAEMSHPPQNGLHPEITAQVIAYLDGKGVPERSRVSLVAEVTGLSSVQARRRLLPDGPDWTVDELVRLAWHYGDTLTTLLPAFGTSRDAAACQPCEVQIAGHWYGAQARIGQQASLHKRGELVAVQQAHRWRIVPADEVAAGTACHEIADITLLPKPSQNVLIAILDDDASVAQALRDALISGGFSATALTDEQQLMQRFHQFDVFIIDFVLGAGRTASTVIEAIRAAKPRAPIIVLTGHAREAASSDIAGLVRAHGIDVQEKPAQVMMLESIIESRLEGWRRPSS